MFIAVGQVIIVEACDVAGASSGPLRFLPPFEEFGLTVPLQAKQEAFWLKSASGLVTLGYGSASHTIENNTQLAPRVHNFSGGTVVSTALRIG